MSLIFMLLYLCNPVSYLKYFWKKPGYNSSLVAYLVKNPPAMQGTPVWCLGWDISLEKG